MQTTKRMVQDNPVKQYSPGDVIRCKCKRIVIRANQVKTVIDRRCPACFRRTHAYRMLPEHLDVYAYQYQYVE